MAIDPLLRGLVRGLGIVARQHLFRMRSGLVLGHSACSVDERELVGVYIELRQQAAGLRVGSGGVEQFALGVHRHVFAGSHRQRAGEQSGHAGEEDEVRTHTARAYAEDQGQIADEPVVCPEDGGAKGSGEPVAPPFGKTAQYLAVDVLIGGHRRGRIRVGVVRGARLSSLCQGEHEERPEPAGQKTKQAGAQVPLLGLAHLVAEQIEPMGLVACFGVGQAEQDVFLLALPAFGEIAVHRCFGPFVGEILSPLANLGLRRRVPVVLRRDGCRRHAGPSVGLPPKAAGVLRRKLTTTHGCGSVVVWPKVSFAR